jgi:hypothetical protein
LISIEKNYHIISSRRDFGKFMNGKLLSNTSEMVVNLYFGPEKYKN